MPLLQKKLGMCFKQNGSFNIHEFETFKVVRDCNMDESNKCFRYDKPTRGKCEAMSIRVVVEFILAFYFGGEIKDDLFEIFSKNIEEYLEVEDGKYTNMIISMTKG